MTVGTPPINGTMKNLYSFQFVKPSRRSNVGIILLNKTDGEVCVAQVDERGLAAASGLKVGDIIHQINGFSMKGRKASAATYIMESREGEVTVFATRYHEQGQGCSIPPLSFQVDKPNSKKAIVGISFRNNDDGDVFVSKITKDGIAANCGIAINDILVEINGVSMMRKDSSAAANAIKEAVGNITIVVTRRKKEGTRVDPNILLTSEVEEVPPPGVEAGGIWGEIDYVGPLTIFLACFLCLTIFTGVLSCDCSCDRGSCKEDKKKGYMIDGQVFDKRGKLIGLIDAVDFRLKG